MSEDNKIRRRQEPPRPQFPKRAIVTAGMPYGNKELHFAILVVCLSMLMSLVDF